MKGEIEREREEKGIKKIKKLRRRKIINGEKQKQTVKTETETKAVK